jgi:FtsP/CotA-like multicopper oxidase with cupredoxin domain
MAMSTRLREESIGELRRQSAQTLDSDIRRPAPQRLTLARAAAAPFRNPPVLNASDGEVTLEVKYATNVIGGDTVNLRSYGGKLVGPTLKVKAGQTLKVKLVNHLPTEPTGVPHVENGHHEWNTTNLHTHGLHVKPQASPASTMPAAVESDNPRRNLLVSRP